MTRPLTRILFAFGLLALACVATFAGAKGYAQRSAGARRQVVLGGWIAIGVTWLLAFTVPYLLVRGTDNPGAILVFYFFLILGAGVSLLFLSAILGAITSKPPTGGSP